MFEEFAAITPINFFQFQANVRQTKEAFPSLTEKNYKKYLLPDLSSLCSEDAFAQVACGWSTEGVEFYVESTEAFTRSSFPDVVRGDSIELWIDPRDIKTAGFNTRFCHHFFFLLEAIDGHVAGEITRFRTEDAHELCDPHRLEIKAKLYTNGYRAQIFIPNDCLHGYDPDQFDRLGFTYRINRAKGFAQHYSVVTEDYQIEQQPSLWSSLKLIR